VKHEPRLLYWGALSWGSTSLARMRALATLVGDCYAINSRELLGEYLYRTLWQRIKYRVAFPPLIKEVSAQLFRECHRYQPDIVWIDQGSVVSRDVLAEMRENGSTLIHYTLDSLQAPGMLNRVFLRAIPEYDYCVTSKAHEASEYARLGARQVLLTADGFDPAIHRPVEMSREDGERFGCDVAFIGQAMSRRINFLTSLAFQTTATLKVYGRGWPQALQPCDLNGLAGGWVFGHEYALAICGAKIALAMLNESVGDQQTTRCFEIPACGTFMLSQRTPALCELFREDREAAFFESEQELIDKVHFYLAHDAERRRIADAGYVRVQSLRCSWRDRMSDLLHRIESK
jgi:spore maturation protein CgeB